MKKIKLYEQIKKLIFSCFCKYSPFQSFSSGNETIFYQVYLFDV